MLAVHLHAAGKTNQARIRNANDSTQARVQGASTHTCPAPSNFHYLLRQSDRQLDSLPELGSRRRLLRGTVEHNGLDGVLSESGRDNVHTDPLNVAFNRAIHAAHDGEILAHVGRPDRDVLETHFHLLLERYIV